MLPNDLNYSNCDIGSTWRGNVMIYLKRLKNDIEEFSNIKPKLGM